MEVLEQLYEDAFAYYCQHQSLRKYQSQGFLYICHHLFFMNFHIFYDTDCQLSRDHYNEYMTTLAIVATSLEKFMTEIRNLQRTEIFEVMEEFKKGPTLTVSIALSIRAILRSISSYHTANFKPKVIGSACI